MHDEIILISEYFYITQLFLPQDGTLTHESGENLFKVNPVLLSTNSMQKVLFTWSV